MRIVLIRHGESEANRLGIKQGKTIDTSLSELGRKQAGRVAERLKNEKIDLIYASNLKRARETAEAIAKHHNLNVIIDERLTEADEDKSDVERQIRDVKSFMKDLEDKEGNIVIVAHGGTNRTFLAISTGNRKKGGMIARRAKQGNSCINILERKDGKYKIELINCLGHLDKDEHIISLFERVQKIPYKVCEFDETNVSDGLTCGDCRHKSFLLFKLLTEKGYQVKRTKIIFDWKDLPIPKDILAILKKSGTISTHDSVRVKFNGDFLHLDCAWDPSLANAGFPVTKNWTGLRDTEQITNGDLEFYSWDSEEYKERMKQIHIDKDEMHKFSSALNTWLDSIRENKRALRANLPLRKNCEGYFITSEGNIIARDTGKGYLEFPGGGLDEGEDPEKALIREAYEEAGVILEENLEKIGVIRFIWGPDWAKTEKQKLRYQKYKGEEMHLFKGKVRSLISPPGDKANNEPGWPIPVSLPLFKALEIVQSSSAPKGLEEYRALQARTLKEFIF